MSRAMMVRQIEAFFIDYNMSGGKVFKPLRRRGPRTAWKLAQAAHRRAADRAG